MRLLTAVDQLFLLLESRKQPMHVGGLFCIRATTGWAKCGWRLCLSAGAADARVRHGAAQLSFQPGARAVWRFGKKTKSSMWSIICVMSRCQVPGAFVNC